MKVIFLVSLFIASSKALHEHIDSLSFSIDETKCDFDKLDEWDLVDYKSVGIEPRFTDLALRANSDSCLSIVNHAVLNGHVEIDLCTYLVSQESGVEVLVYDNSDVIFLKRKFTILNDEYKDGWNTIEIPLKDFKGYINIIGHSTGIEIILIDAMRFVLHTSGETQVINIKLHDDIKHEVLLTTKSENDYDIVDDLLLIYNEPDDDNDLDSIEGSGGVTPNETTENPSTEDLLLNETTGNWNAFTISLTVIGSVAGLSALLFGAYYFGKTRAATGTFLEEFDDMESTVTIPRVRPTFRYEY